MILNLKTYMEKIIAMAYAILKNKTNKIWIKDTNIIKLYHDGKKIAMTSK